MILRQGLVAHLSFAIDGQPYVIPMSYVADPDSAARIYHPWLACQSPHTGISPPARRSASPSP